MTIRRTRLDFERDFVQIPNDWMRDSRLSHRARGILAEVMTHAEGWHVTVEHLVDNGTEGREAVRTAIAELVEVGYLTLRRIQDDSGKFGGSTYDLADPTERRVSGAPADRPTGKPTPQESAPKNTNSLEDKNEEQAEAFALFWKTYPRKKGAPAKALVQRLWARKVKDYSVATIQAGLEQQIREWTAEQRPTLKMPMISTWLNQDRWDTLDEVDGTPTARRPVEDAYSFSEHQPVPEPDWSDTAPWMAVRP